jgi:hypothetical protein
MITLNILSKAFKHILIFMSTAYSSCNHAPHKPEVAKVIEVVAPTIYLGDTSRLVCVTIDLKKAVNPSFKFTDLPYDKSKGLLLMKDDGINTDYTIVYKVLNGGIVNGKKYPGYFYTDGTGKKINYKYSFAINANDEHSTSPNATTWAQMAEMVSKGHSLMNHTMFHGGSDKLKAIKDAEKNLWTHTHYRMTEFVPPGNEEGFVASGIQLGYTMFSSEFGDPIPDGNNDPGNQNMTWNSSIPMLTQNFNRVLVSRTNLGDQWNATELPNTKAFVDYIFKSPQKSQKLVGTAFSHGPFADNKESAEIFNDFLSYIQNHPNNRDSAWITSSKELMDYVNTKSKVKITSENYMHKTGKYTLIFDMNEVNQNVIYRNLSFKITGGIIDKVSVTGAAEATFNPATGLINIYKLDRSKVKSPFLDLLPPQIIALKLNGQTLHIQYDKPVQQSKKEAYDVSGNTVLNLKGNGRNWQIILKNPVTSEQTFSYRMQKGDAHQDSNILLKVCSYIAAKISK